MTRCSTCWNCRVSKASAAAAEKHCHRAITLDARNVDAELALGELYSLSGMHDEAIAQLLSLAAQTPYSVEAIRTLGEAYLAAGAVELAQIQFNKSVQLEPGYWRNYKALGDVPVRQGRYSEAVEPDWRAVSLAANKAGPLGNVAVVLYLSEEFEDAVDVRLQALVWARLDERDRLEKVIAQLIKAGYSEALIKRDANFGGSANSNHAIPRKSAPQSVQRDVFVDDSLGEPEIDS